MPSIPRKPLQYQQFFRASSVKHAVNWSRHRLAITVGLICKQGLVTNCHLNIPRFELTLPPYCTVANSNGYCLGKSAVAIMNNGCSHKTHGAIQKFGVCWFGEGAIRGKLLYTTEVLYLFDIYNRGQKSLGHFFTLM